MKLLADENIPWPLVRALRGMGLDVLWVPETEYRGVSNSEPLDLANKFGRILVTRDRDFLARHLVRKAKHGLIYIGEPVRKENVDRLAQNLAVALGLLKKGKRVVIVTSVTIEIYRPG